MNMFSRFSLGLVASSVVLAGAANAASSIVSGGTDHLVAGDVNDYYYVSVNSSDLSYGNTYTATGPYASTTFTNTFSGSIEAYRFVNVTGNSTNRTMNTTAVGGTRIAQMTNSEEASKTGFDSFGQNRLKGYDVSSPADQLAENTTSRDFTAGIRDLSDFTGEVDITGMTSGSLYVIYGKYNGGSLSLTAAMSGTALTDINSAELFDGAAAVSNQNIYVSRIDFVNDQGYETLTYTSDGSRLVGAVLTTIPEPSSFALLGLGGLALCVRRRK